MLNEEEVFFNNSHKFSLLRYDSLACSATTELLMYAQGKQKILIDRVETQDVNVENPQWWEKPRKPTDC